MKLIAVFNGKSVPIDIIKENGKYSLTIGDESFTVDAVRTKHRLISLLVEGKSYEAGVDKKGNSFSVSFYNDTIHFELFEARKYKATEFTRKSVPSGPLKVLAPMPGKIVKVAVVENSRVNQGDALLVMEAMKMQNELKAPRAGLVKKIQVKEGEPVSPSQILLILE
jgi:biotin carboxyl carrier protein